MTAIESFSTKLKTLREKKGLNQSELGESLGVSRGSISFYEKAERIPDIDFLVKTANFFDVPVDYLLGLSSVSEKNVDTDLKAVSDYIGLDYRIVSELHGATLCNEFDSEGNIIEHELILFIKEFLGDYSDFTKIPYSYLENNVPNLIFNYLKSLRDYNAFLSYKFDNKGFSLDNMPKDNFDKHLLYFYEAKQQSDEKLQKINESYNKIFEALEQLVSDFCLNEISKSHINKERVEAFIKTLNHIKNGGEFTDDYFIMESCLI